MRTLPLPLIRRLVPLKGLHEQSLLALLDQSELQLVGRGLRLFSQSEHGRYFYYLLSGEAELAYATGAACHTPEILYPIGYATQGLLSATARTDCLCLRIDKTLLDRQLCWDHVAAAIELDLSYQPEYDGEVSWRLALLRSNLFVKVPPLNIDQIFSRLKPMQVQAGDVIVRQGDAGDGCYFIRRGTASVTRRQPGEDKERQIVDIGMGRCFGEDALIHETVRNATVTMRTDGFLLRLDKPDFMLLLREPEPDHIKASDLEAALGAGAVLLDVRTEEEFEVARLHAAEPVSLSCLRLVAATQLAMTQEYILCCDTGRRSRAAANLLQRLGFRARYLLNGMESLDEQRRVRLQHCVPPLSPTLADPLAVMA